MRRAEINGMIRGKQIWLRDRSALVLQVNVAGKGGQKVGKAKGAVRVIRGGEKMSLAESAQTLGGPRLLFACTQSTIGR